MFTNGEIGGVIVRPLTKHEDRRGWLFEMFRSDELDPEYLPAMSYISMTLPKVTRGPHEHVDQADLFCFVGPSNFKVVLWDNRRKSPTHKNRGVLYVGEDHPSQVIIPAGVVHAYRNVGEKPGWVINFPNRLYKGAGEKEPVDEIRHEANPLTEFQIDEA